MSDTIEALTDYFEEKSCGLEDQADGQYFDYYISHGDKNLTQIDVRALEIDSEEKLNVEPVLHLCIEIDEQGLISYYSNHKLAIKNEDGSYEQFEELGFPLLKNLGLQGDPYYHQQARLAREKGLNFIDTIEEELGIKFCLEYSESDSGINGIKRFANTSAEQAGQKVIELNNQSQNSPAL